MSDLRHSFITRADARRPRRFKVTEVALLMDWDDSDESSGSGTEEEQREDMWNVSKAVSTLREKENSSGTRRSIRGLQMAIAEGWLIQRARDMCSFSHDRYRQAAQAEAESQPEETIAKMSFRVSTVHPSTGGAVVHFCPLSRRLS